jgi:uncharacterized protein GlcG (DUF336 family)
MTRQLAATALAAALALPAALAAPPQVRAQEALVSFEALAPDIALKAAEAALAHCTAQGYQSGVTVTDRFGVPQVFLRERFAGPHVYETSYRKAWTAASFGMGTTMLGEETGPDSAAAAIRDLTLALPLGGGLPIESGDGALVGAIGVSGAPSPAADDDCAQAGIDAIFDDIAF